MALVNKALFLQIPNDNINNEKISIPKIEGKAVKVRGQWPITLKAPNIR